MKAITVSARFLSLDMYLKLLEKAQAGSPPPVLYPKINRGAK